MDEFRQEQSTAWNTETLQRSIKQNSVMNSLPLRTGQLILYKEHWPQWVSSFLPTRGDAYRSFGNGDLSDMTDS